MHHFEQDRRNNADIAAAFNRAGDNCGLCKRPLRHLEATFLGFYRRRLYVVGDACCGDRLTIPMWGGGEFYSPAEIIGVG